MSQSDVRDICTTLVVFYSFRSQSTSNFTRAQVIPVGMYVRFITYLPILITSSTAILNSPINSFCLDTALVLTSDNFHSICPPSPPILSSSYTAPPGGCYPKLSHGAIFTVYSHTFTLFWLRRISVIVKMYQLIFCVYVCLSSNDLFIFAVRVSYFFVIHISALSLPCGLYQETSLLFII